MLEQTNSSIRVACTFIPLHGYNVLIPNACIDEVFKIGSIEPVKQSPVWCHGHCKYKNHEIMLINLEAIETGASISPTNNAVAIKLKKPAEFSNSPDIGIFTAKIPHIIQANNYALEIEYKPEHTHTLALSYIKIKEKQAFIPDLKRLYKEFGCSI